MSTPGGKEEELLSRRVVACSAAAVSLFCIALPAFSQEDDVPDALETQARRLRTTLVARMIAPGRGLVLTRTKGDPLEDTSLYGGFYLGALVTAWGVTGDEETAVLARHVLSGLFLNASVGEPGFIARGVRPDRKNFRAGPSVDQYTGLLFGLWEHHRSSLASAQEKQEISKLYGDVLRRLKRDGYRITDTDGSTVTTFGRLADIRPTRAERLLSFLAAGAAITGRDEWGEQYRRERTPRLPALTGFQRFESWVLIQSAASLRMLSNLESDPPALAAVRQACREVADRATPQAAGFDKFLADPRPPAERLADAKLLLRAVRIPVEAVTTVLLVGEPDQAAKTLTPLTSMLIHLPFESFHDSRPLVSLEWAYWLARRRGLL